MFSKKECLRKTKFLFLAVLILGLSGCYLFRSPAPVLTKSSAISVPDLTGFYADSSGGRIEIIPSAGSGGAGSNVFLLRFIHDKSDTPDFVFLTAEPLGGDLYVMELSVIEPGKDPEYSLYLAVINLPRMTVFTSDFTDSTDSYDKAEALAKKYQVVIDRDRNITSYASKEKLMDFFRSLFDSPYVKKKMEYFRQDPAPGPARKTAK
ncbi:MAG: hypothetical protein LBK52_07830 [Deltaproteobacteria bacterium]|jgi:hypothetical protein|nr:hypothetical protein [Deltaproteobacteria bacterium]